MEHSKTWKIELDHGTNWTTLYEIEIFGEINPGSRGDRVTPGEAPFVDGPIRIEVREVIDYRFGDTGCPVDYFDGGYSDKTVGEWLLKQLSEDEITALTEVLLEDWAERQDDILSREWDER